MRSETILAWTASLIFLAACGKISTPENAPRPTLEAPARGGYSVATVPPAAEVSNSSGGLKISLSVPTTLYHDADRTIWVKVEMTNIGAEPLLVYSRSLFAGAQALLLPDILQIEIQGPRGEKVFPSPSPHGASEDCRSSINSMSRREMMAAYAFFMGVGESTATAAGFGPCPPAEAKPIGDYGAISGLHLVVGTHRVRAIYDRTRPEGISGTSPGEVLIRSPWIVFEVKQ